MHHNLPEYQKKKPLKKMYSELLYDMATSSSVLAELSSQITKKKKTKQKSLQSTEKPPYILISIV